MRLACGLSFVALAASAQFASPAAAAGGTREMSVQGTLVISTDNDPANLGDCGTLVFYQWKDVPNTVSATVTFTAATGKEHSETAAGPSFHDYMTKQKPPRYAPLGSHWISVGWSYSSGGSPTQRNTKCKDYFEPKMRAYYPATAKIVLTVEDAAPKTDPAKCKAARSALKARNKTVSKLLGKLKRAKGKKAKDRVRRQLAKAKTERAKAVRKVVKTC